MGAHGNDGERLFRDHYAAIEPAIKQIGLPVIVVNSNLDDFYKKKFGLDIELYNGKGRLGLPVPGTFVIDTSGRIVAVHAELDYKQRMEPQAIIDALKTIKR